MSLPCPSVPKINFASPSSVHDGGVKASINDNDEGSNGLYGVINSTKDFYLIRSFLKLKSPSKTGLKTSKMTL